jgi:outer membrane protein assembly factor BamD
VIKKRQGIGLMSLRSCATILALVIAAACASTPRGTVPAGTTEPDKFLFDKGTDALNAKKWLTAREYFKQVTETYTASPYRPDAKLGIGDTYLGEGSAEALVLAINEFTEFLSFYPTNRRADYAQYKLGIAHFRQMRSPQRDQTETRDALREFQTFVNRYPNSELMPEVKAKLRETRDRLSESELEVGQFYYRIRWYPGALDRLNLLLKDDPEFTSRDEVIFYIAESMLKVGRAAEALPYFERIVKEFEQSERVEAARRSGSRPPCTIPKIAWSSRVWAASDRAAQRWVRSVASATTAYLELGKTGWSKATATSEPSASWTPIAISGVNRWTDPSRWLRNVTPSSSTTRRSPSETTWKPPESVRIGPSQSMNR